LKALNAEALYFGGEAEAISAALVEARSRSTKEDRRQAKEVRKQFVALLTTAEVADRALATLVETSSPLKEIARRSIRSAVAIRAIIRSMF
jgi:hypothetical protein